MGVNLDFWRQRQGERREQGRRKEKRVTPGRIVNDCELDGYSCIKKAGLLSSADRFQQSVCSELACGIGRKLR